MDSKERALRILNLQEADRVAFDFEVASPEVWDRLLQHYGVRTCEDILRILHIDFRNTAVYTCAGIPPKHVGGDIYKNAWGVKFSMSMGMVVEHPLSDEASFDDIDSYGGWLNPDEVDYMSILENMDRSSEYAVYGGYWSPFWYIYQMLMGMDNSMVLLYEKPDVAEYLMDKILSIALEINRRIFEKARSRMQIFYVGDDFGTQSDLQISPEMWRKFLKPRIKKLYDLATHYGYIIQQHSCGSVIKVIPDLVELGMRGLNPIQTAARDMDIRILKQRFGHCVCFNGGIDTQTTLPFGTVEDVKKEVIDRIVTLAPGGGYVLAPSQSFMSDVPTQNIIAMYETGYHYGWYDSLGKYKDVKFNEL